MSKSIMQNTSEVDIYTQALKKALEELKECQKSHFFDSCFKCSKLLGCELRKKYVDKVYASMNKGHGGGFEF